jgi:ribonuclease T1
LSIQGKPVALIGPLCVEKSLRKFGLTLAVVLSLGASFGVMGLTGMVSSAQARDTTEMQQAAGVAGTVALADLPPEARSTERLIRAGGPFPHGKDGVVFGNRERLLPRQPRGHYREYTVRTPGSRDRGARRIVCGGRQPREPEACFYTEDHYASFRRIVP